MCRRAISCETGSLGTIALQHIEVLEKLTKVFEAATKRDVETNQQMQQIRLHSNLIGMSVVCADSLDRGMPAVGDAAFGPYDFDRAISVV